MIAFVGTFFCPDRIDPYGCPAICSLELMDPMALQQDVQYSRSEMVIGTVFQNDINVRVLDFTKEFPLRHESPPKNRQHHSRLFRNANQE
jgi:hypothetical protein